MHFSSFRLRPFSLFFDLLFLFSWDGIERTWRNAWFLGANKGGLILSVLDDRESVHDHVGDEGKDDGKEVDGLSSGNRLHLLRCGFFDDRIEHQRVRRLVGMNHR